MKRILTAMGILLVSMFIPVSMSAQSGYQVKGTVVDAQGPVIGAAVVEKGTTTGTMTDLDGSYALKVSGPNAVVEVSCIGYTTQTFTASAMPSKITLAEDALFLDDVVVIGYGTVKKEDLTGSVATVKADEINKGAITSPADLMRGKSAGVVVTSGSGQPGSAATIRIRGGASLSASNNPLIVIDGLPISNDGISGMADPLSSINPGDIESFTVLKDASATAIYGSRASNGVIVITTKKGSRSASAIPQVEANFQTSVSHVSKYVNVMNAEQLKSAISNHLSEDAAASALAVLGDANTNWQKEIYQVAPAVEGNVTVNGKANIGNDIVLPYRVSAGLLTQKGTLKTDKMNRGTLSLNLSPSFFDKHLTVNLNGKATHTKSFFANQDAIGAAIHYAPTQPVYDENGLNGYSTWFNASGGANEMATQNPVALLNERTSNGTANRFIGNAQFDYKVHGFEDLRLNLNLGIDAAKSTGIEESPIGSEQSYHGSSAGGGYHNDYYYNRKDETLEFYADYNKQINDLNHIDVMAGYSWQHFWSKNGNGSYRLSDNMSLSSYEGRTEYFLISFFGRLNYTLADKYLFTATVRRDGTSRFRNHKWGLFPSLAFAWNMKKEPFLASVEPLSTAKLRLSWGKTGQQDLNQGDYPTLALYYQNNASGSLYQFGGNTVYPITALGYNPDLKWETTTTYNVGTDLGFWNDRLTAAIDFYYRKTTDLLNYIPVPALSNLTNHLTTNIGNMENKGVEIDLNGIIISKADMSWTAGVNFAYNRNRITKLTASANDTDGVAVGGISGGTGNTIQQHQVGFPAYAFYVYQQVYDSNGNPIEGEYVDRNGDGKWDANDKYYFHKPTPDVTMGFNTQFDYKNWTVAMSAHSSFGNYVYNNVASNNEMWADLWTNNFVSNRLVSAEKSNFSQARYLSDYYVRDASFFKLDNITVGYNFPRIFTLAQRDVRLNIFGTVQNVCTITKYDGVDPEIFGGIDNNIYPRPRTYVLGLKLNF